MSEIIVAVVFFFLGLLFYEFCRNRQRKEHHQMKLESGISYEVKCAKDLRENKTDNALSMIEHKIYDHLLFTMQITKKGNKITSCLDFDKTNPGIIEAWQQGKEYFATYGMDTIHKYIDIIPKNTEGWELATKSFEMFQVKLKEVPLTFKEKYTGENALPAPEPEFDTWDDDPVTLEQLRSKVVLLNIWAMGCVPCKLMMPELEKLKEQYGEKGLEVISIAPPCKDEKPVADFFSNKEYTFTKALASSKTWTIYPIRGVPTNFLINKNGFLVEGPTHELPDTSVLEELLDN